jgi:glyoxylase-like metal-dependent hydrolase (beta-lactamase superfamily II)
MINTPDSLSRSMTRRDLFRAAGLLTGGALVARFSPTLFAAGSSARLGQAAPAAQAAPPALDPVAATAARRQMLGAIPIQQTKLGEKIVLLSGPGGNVIVLQGPDGKVIADCFVTPAWPGLKSALEALDASPVKLLIDTHWHFDHADNNANLHATGAAILAHENTKQRLTESHDALGMHFDPAPPGGLPTETFKDTHKLHVNGDDLTLEHVAPAHTDGDIFIHYAKANVLHMGDVFFNGNYPFIDASTGGNIDGMITGADRALKLADASTKIVPGHGPLGDKAALVTYRDMLATTRDAVKKLKTGGKSLAEVQAAKPTAAFDGVWGKGMLNADMFVAIVYNTL